MKTKLFILVALLGSLLFFNCQTDDNASRADTHSKFSMKKISLEKMKSKPKAVEALNKIRETQTAGAQAKLVYDSANDFYVDTEEIIYIEKGGDYHSYTFAVYRDEETALFENLVISLQKDGSYSATLISYNLTEQERKALEEEKLYSLEGKLAARVLDPGTYNPEYLLGRTNCYNVNVATCSWGGSVHIAGARCKPDGVATIRVCYEYEEPVPYFEDTASGDSGGGGGGSGGGGTGDLNPTTTDPDPTPDPDSDNEEPEDELGDEVVTVPLIKNPKTPHEKNCDELKNLKPVIKNNINQLNLSPNLNLNYEIGYRYDDDTQDGAFLQGNPNEPHIQNLGLNPNTYGYVHIHYNNSGLSPTFTPEDVRSFFPYFQHRLLNNKPTDNLFAMVISAEGTYALKIKDIQEFDEAAMILVNEDDFFQYKKDFEKDYPTFTNMDDVERNVIKNIENLGLSLYVMDQNLNSWAEVKINPIDQSIYVDECN